MSFSQVPSAVSTNKLRSSLLNFLLSINIIAILTTFTLNFLGSPALKYFYLVHLLITLIAILKYDFIEIFPIFLALFFIDGQGRILWEYSSWSRIIFDLLLFFSVAQMFIKYKKIADTKSIPKILIVLIALHFSWYLIEFSNLHSVSYFATLGAMKVYIFPFFFFLGLIQSDFNKYEHHFQKILNFYVLIILLEIALCIYQFNMKEILVLKISSFYIKSIRGNVFTDILYRPHGTTFAPGVISAYVSLTVGFLFLKKNSTRWSILRIILIFMIGYLLVLCQVRAALIKFFLIIIIIQLGEIFYFRLKPKSFDGLISIFSLLIFSTVAIKNYTPNDKAGDINYARERFLSILDYKQIKKSRIDANTFINVAMSKLTSMPLGLGPGFTGAAGSLSSENMVGNRFINDDMIWGFDNLFISLIIDFGIGAFFYISIIFYIPIYFFRFLIHFYVNKKYEEYKFLLICFGTIVTIIAGNWGAIGIPYNPESFTFWFFTSMGFLVIKKYKNTKHLSLTK